MLEEQKEKLLPFSIGWLIAFSLHYKDLVYENYLTKWNSFSFVTRFLQKFEINPEIQKCLPSLEPVME